MSDDRRLIEDYLPLAALSAEAAREKGRSKGHISSIHLWWARRPLTVARAAVFASLVPSDPSRRTELAAFVARLCRYPGEANLLVQAARELASAQAARQACDGQGGTRTDRPRVLDPFAGGGAIPLEAAKLGCESYALELNPVAHIVELVTLDYARRFGTWLSDEIERVGNLILTRAWSDLGDLYASPEKHEGAAKRKKQLTMDGGTDEVEPPPLEPIVYVWTRTVPCKRADCGAEVPLMRSKWLCKEPGRAVALRTSKERGSKKVRYEVVDARTAAALKFDPDEGSVGGNAICPFCLAVADETYVKEQGQAGKIGQKLAAIICQDHRKGKKVYLSPHQAGDAGTVPDAKVAAGIEKIRREAGFGPPEESLPEQGTLGFRVQAYGMKKWRDVFTSRQLICLMTFAKHIRQVHTEMLASGLDTERAKAVAAGLACVLDRLAHFNSSLCVLDPSRGSGIKSTFLRTALPMTWDFPETNPFNGRAASWPSALRDVSEAIRGVGEGGTASVNRGSATELPFEAEFFDAVVTDPPYYDNVPYAALSDFFYVWLKRTIGDLYPEHFATEVTPKKREAIAEPARFGGNKQAARDAYEQMMAQAFREIGRVLKPGAPLVCVYAHKTVAGWATLIDALRSAGFVVAEAWPLTTENPGRLRANDSAALASSIFLVARRREGHDTGSYEREVQPELAEIVWERTDTLWDKGVTGADLVIAAVGAGLRAFTKFERVEFENGQVVPSDRFIREVEGAVLETVLRNIGVRDADPPTKFYLAWRLQYRAVDLDAGEAIVFAYPLGVELDGAEGVTAGTHALVEKKGRKMRLRDYNERGDSEKLGVAEDGEAKPLIDVLQRVLWLMENSPAKLRSYIEEVRPDGERLKLVAQAVAGTALQGEGDQEGSVTPEQAAARKLIANWRNLFEETLFSR